jgi:uncharacterized protein (TIGR02285 family)
MKNSFIIFCFIACCKVYAQAKPEMTWITDSQADIPFFLKKQPTYIAMETVNLLASSIKDYQIKLNYAPLARVDYLLQNKQNICAVSRIKNAEREAFGLFSLPLNLYPGLRLYYVENRTTNKIPEQLLNKQNQIISLSALFNALPAMKLGINHSRSYGKILDKDIASLLPKNIYIRAGENHRKATIDMLMQNRIDFLVEFPTDFNAESKKINKTVKFKSIEIANSPRYILGHLACNKSEKSKIFINEINKSLLALYRTKEFYQAHIKYLDRSDIDKFKQYYQEVFLSY